MKISDVKIYTLDSYRMNWAFIKVETDDGLYGWGEASLGTNELALEGMIADLKRLIVGRNPLEIEKMCFEVYRDIYWKGGAVLMSAISGIEIALWDIAGKYFNTPTYNLFGGKMRDKVKMYANAWFVGAREPEDFARKAKNTVDLGIKALKWDPFGSSHMTITNEQLEKTINIVGAVREAARLICLLNVTEDLIRQQQSEFPANLNNSNQCFWKNLVFRIIWIQRHM